MNTYSVEFSFIEPVRRIVMNSSMRVKADNPQEAVAKFRAKWATTENRVDGVRDLALPHNDWVEWN